MKQKYDEGELKVIILDDTYCICFEKNRRVLDDGRIEDIPNNILEREDDIKEQKKTIKLLKNIFKNYKKVKTK